MTMEGALEDEVVCVLLALDDRHFRDAEVVGRAVGPCPVGYPPEGAYLEAMPVAST